MFVGMRGNGDWVAEQRPKSWREQILKLYPNGSAPLTAILSMMGSRVIDDPEFNWWTQEQGAAGGAVAGVYTDEACITAYTTNTGLGSIVYVLATTLLCNRVRIGHQILLRDASDYTVDVVGKVVSVTRGTTNTVLGIKLLEADDNSTSHDLSDCDIFKVIGNINPEGGEMPDSIALNPTKVYNYTQIFRTSLSITNTAKVTKLRTGDQYQKMKAEALEMHSWEMELAFIFGIRTEGIGDNGKPERTTRGLLEYIKTYAPANCVDYTLDSSYSGKSWVSAGDAWLDTYLEQVFRYGATDKLCLCGSGFLLGLNNLAKANGNIQIQPGQTTYGIKVMNWVTPFGSIQLKTHPLFSADVTTRYMGILLEPSEIEYCYLPGRDTKFIPYKDSEGHKDATEEEFLTECGLEFGLAQKCGIFNGVGQDNSLS